MVAHRRDEVRSGKLKGHAFGLNLVVELAVMPVVGEQGLWQQLNCAS